MKIVRSIIATFILAFATSSLLELSFFEQNPVRYALVVLLIVIELATGYFYIKSEIKNLK